MKVLIVDDEPLARDELSYLLEQNDLIDEINEADGINSAREEVANKLPDLIFMIFSWMMVVGWHLPRA